MGRSWIGCRSRTSHIHVCGKRGRAALLKFSSAGGGHGTVAVGRIVTTAQTMAALWRRKPIDSAPRRCSPKVKAALSTKRTVIKTLGRAARRDVAVSRCWGRTAAALAVMRRGRSRTRAWGKERRRGISYDG